MFPLGFLCSFILKICRLSPEHQSRTWKLLDRQTLESASFTLTLVFTLPNHPHSSAKPSFSQAKDIKQVFSRKEKQNLEIIVYAVTVSHTNSGAAPGMAISQLVQHLGGYWVYWSLDFSRATMRLTCLVFVECPTTIGRIAVEFAADIHGARIMNLTNFSDRQTFHVAPLAGQSFHLPSVAPFQSTVWFCIKKHANMIN